MFFLLKSCFSSDLVEDKNAQLNNLKIRALVYSHNCVEERLKSPSTADFPSGTDGVMAVNDSLFIVNSYVDVDSQNGFGAMIRAKYQCNIIIIDEDHYQYGEVVLSE
jgi:hypothetical protein